MAKRQIKKKKRKQKDYFIVCPNCGSKTKGHFVPPSFGDEGFFICEGEYNSKSKPPGASK